MPVLAVVSVEDVADNHAGLPYSTITNQHAAQFVPQSVWFVMSLTGLCHFFLVLLLHHPSSQNIHGEVKFYCKRCLLPQGPVSPNKGRGTPRFERTKASNQMSDPQHF